MHFDFGPVIALTAIVLSLSIPIIAIIVEHFTEKSKMRIMEKAIEKGLPLEGLSFGKKKEPRMPYRAGMVSLAVGLGLCIFGLLIGQQALNPILGGGAIAALVGIALIINDRINYDRYFKKDADPQ